MSASGVSVDPEKVEAVMSWKIREWAKVVHSGQDRRTSPMGHRLLGWDSPDHRERDQGCSEHLGCGCW